MEVKGMNAVIMKDKDTVVTVTAPIAANETVTYIAGAAKMSVVAVEAIPMYHKIAVCDIAAGASVIKYGEHIGFATRDINAGQHVHTQNMSSTLSEREGEK